MKTKLDVRIRVLGGTGLLAITLAGCMGGLGASDSAEENGGAKNGGDSGGNGGPDAFVASAVYSGIRRLSRTEYDDTLRALLQDETRSGFGKLPEDVQDPFDNDYTTQMTSAVLVEGAETLAEDAANRALLRPEVMNAIVPCQPAGAGDAECLKAFIRSFGKRALRRPLTDDEVARFATLGDFSVEKGDFTVGVGLVIRAMLQDPEFLHRVEIGTPVAGEAGVFKLNDYEVAARLSYLLLGTTPPDDLLALADEKRLSTQADVRAAAEVLLSDPRARARTERFHALWLGYHQLPHDVELSTAMQDESNALVDRVIFDDKADYFQLFESEETFIGDVLAGQYDMPAPATPEGAWTSYGGTGRRGILSHGSVLSAFAKFSDTSPTQRGIFVRTRLLCQEVAPPPPTVAADQPPEAAPGACKKENYAAHADVGSCKGCHSQLDPVGWGLEQYDKGGKFRTHDDGKPECAVSGDGELVGYGTFNGPAELGSLLVSSGGLESCLVKQVYRFAMGRKEAPVEASFIESLGRSFGEGGHRFDNLMVDIAGSLAFGLRREEE